MLRLFRSLGCFLVLACVGVASAAAPIGAQALQLRHTTLAPQLARSPLGGPMHLESQEAAQRIEGEIYAELDIGFDQVAGALSDVGQWCDILILHLNTKYCHRSASGAATHVELRVGKKEEQPVQDATLLDFEWKPPVVRPDYVQASMRADSGPYSTRDYQIVAEAVPVGPGRTFVHIGYAFGYSGSGHLAMHVYLATVGRNKIGFTRVDGQYVQGMRGIAERNTMRYFLAVKAYLESLREPAALRLDKRLQAWFDATERYAPQLHEIDRDAYLRMKRSEVQRQVAATH